jgi:enoyl-CoA hydratase/carnithine racemase
MSENLAVSLEEGVFHITLNRPEKRNALTAAMCRALVDAFEEAETDPGAGAVLLDAAGAAFSAGMDLAEAVAPGAAGHSAVHEELFTIGTRLAVPVVAAVAGPALGGGLGLLANSHIAIAAQGSSFGLTEIRIGMWPFVVYRAVALAVGERRALDLSLTGRIFGTQEALAWGLVQQVVPAFELADRAWQVAAGLAASSRDAIRRGLRFLNETRGLPPDEVGRRALEARRAVFESDDFKQRAAAFLKSRKPPLTS